MPANVSVFRRMPASYTSTLSLHDALPISELDTRFVPGAAGCPHARDFARTVPLGWSDARGRRDRKSTRLNSSHSSISYAVFCLKKITLLRYDDAHALHYVAVLYHRGSVDA